MSNAEVRLDVWRASDSQLRDDRAYGFRPLLVKDVIHEPLALTLGEPRLVQASVTRRFDHAPLLRMDRI